jgi:hypothetical protein
VVNEDIEFGAWFEDRFSRLLPTWRKMTPKARAAALLDIAQAELSAHLLPDTEFDDRFYGMIDAIHTIYGVGKLDQLKDVEP